MNFVEKLSSIEKRFALSFLGFIIGIAGAGLGIYTEFFKDNSPRVTFEILSQTNVLSLNADINELKILLGDIDIKSSKQTISLFVARIRNDGNSPITQNSYANDYPFSIQLADGKLIRVETLNASNPYLKLKAVPRLQSGSQAILPAVILENGEWYSIKGLVLHNQDKTPQITVIGKIAGVKQISKVISTIETGQVSFLRTTLGGDWVIQITRGFVYGLGFMLIVATSLFLGIKIDEESHRKNRQRIANQFVKRRKQPLTPKELAVIKDFTEDVHNSFEFEIAHASDIIGMKKSFPHIGPKSLDSIPKYDEEQVRLGHRLIRLSKVARLR